MKKRYVPFLAPKTKTLNPKPYLLMKKRNVPFLAPKPKTLNPKPYLLMKKRLQKRPIAPCLVERLLVRAPFLQGGNRSEMSQSLQFKP
jgi:hypothetical protein